jgi:hypothetical protein
VLPVTTGYSRIGSVASVSSPVAMSRYLLAMSGASLPKRHKKLAPGQICMTHGRHHQKSFLLPGSKKRREESCRLESFVRVVVRVVINQRNCNNTVKSLLIKVDAIVW